MTFSLVARCSTSGMLGVAIASSSPAVAARCSYARAGVGAVASQNVTDPTLGPLMLDLLEQGKTSVEAIAELRRVAKFIDYRQVLSVDKLGQTAIHSGSNSLGIWTEVSADNVASGGNLLANENVPQATLDSFLESNGHIGDRLISALRAGLEQEGIVARWRGDMPDCLRVTAQQTAANDHLLSVLAGIDASLRQGTPVDAASPPQ